MSGLTNEAPRGEGRRGANRRLLAGGQGSAPVVTLTGARPICSAGETSLSAAIRLLAQRLVKSAGDGREPRTCAMLLLDFAGLGFAAHRAFGASACEWPPDFSPGLNPGQIQRKASHNIVTAGAYWLVIVRMHALPQHMLQLRIYLPRLP
jgi:hypothetical protein